MLDVGWTELVLIIAIAVMVVGPSEIPALMVGLGRLFRRITYVKYAFSQQFEEFMKEADMDDLAKSVNFEATDRAPPSESIPHFDEAAMDEDEDYIPPVDEIPDRVRDPMLDGEEKMP